MADDTARLSAQIDATPDGGTLTLPAGGRLRVDGTLHVNDRHGLVIDGRGATLYSTQTTPTTTKPIIPMLDVLGGDGITVRDLRFEGTNTEAKLVAQREWQPFIDIHGTQGVTIEGVQGTGAWGDFVHLAPDTRPSVDVMAGDVLVRDCHTSTIGRNQVSLTGCEDVLIEGCSFSGTGFQVFDIEVQAAGWTARRLTIRDNTIGGKVSLSVLVCSVVGAGVSDVTFTDNAMTSDPTSCQTPVFVTSDTGPKSNITVARNTLRTLSNAASMEGVTGLVFSNNQVSQSAPTCARQNVMFVRNDQAVTVRGNTVVGSYQRLLPDPLTNVTLTAVDGNTLNGQAA